MMQKSLEDNMMKKEKERKKNIAKIEE